MPLFESFVVFLSLLAVLLVLATVPFLVTAISYRQRDNGLAYLLLVLGVGVWNGMAVAQLLGSEPLVKLYFASLAVVGALLAGLGWFLFASTASSTTDVLDRPVFYGAVAVLVGLDIILAITSPVHDLYWLVPTDAGASQRFMVYVPVIGHWLHTALLVVLFGLGAWLFGGAWRGGINTKFSRAYTIAATLTALTLVGETLLLGSQPPLASVMAGSLGTIGWIQARRGRALAPIRLFVRSLRSNR